MNKQPAQEFSDKVCATCKKYAHQFYAENEAGQFPNLALIINDAIAEGIEAYMAALKKDKELA